jgi:transposase
MEVVYPCCCGLDVHKKSISAWVLWAEAKGKSRKEKKRFGTFTHDLLQLADGLAERGVTHLATESTGVYGKPVWNILAEQFQASLVNAQHSKQSEIEQEIDKRMLPFEDKVTRLCTIPGVDRVTAWGMLAEMGMNMNQFPSSGHLASWACLCPGSFESAGKGLSGKMRKAMSRSAVVCRRRPGHFDDEE